MTNEALQQLVETISLQSFGKPFKHRATFNQRLRTTGGRYHLKTHDLDFNPYLYEQYGEAVLIGIIKHELCHYHLHLAQAGYQHRDADFKQLLQKVDGLRYAPRITNEQALAYQCSDCAQIFYRQKRINTNRYVCGKCGGKLQLITEK